jgi:hypothetical protein
LNHPLPAGSFWASAVSLNPSAISHALVDAG